MLIHVRPAARRAFAGSKSETYLTLATPSPVRR